MSEEFRRRLEDNYLSKLVKVWPIIMGVIGIIYALITNYNTVKSNTDSISKLTVLYESMITRVSNLERDGAVKSSQFSVILNRMDRMEDKIDKIRR